MATQYNFVRFLLICLVFFSWCSAESPSSPAIFTTTATFTTDNTVTGIQFAGATATSLDIFYPSVSLTQFRYAAPTVTQVVDVYPSSTQSIIIAGGSVVDIRVEASTTGVAGAAASFAVEVGFGGSKGYNIDARPLNTYCWYPISGNYGRLPRFLFYVVLVFALVAKAHEWLIAGALAAALTYSGVAAVHACLLIWRGPGYGELDLQALIAILSASCIITVPLLNWSKTLRYLGIQKKSNDKWSRAFQKLGIKKTTKDQPTRTIIVYWGFLVTVGFLCVFVSLWKFDVPTSQFTLSGLDTISCTPNGDLNLTMGQNPKWGGFVPDSEFITGNNCVDPCHGFDPWLGQSAIFRSADDLQILTKDQINFLFHIDLRREKGETLQFVKGYQTYGLLFLPYILLQGIWTACFGRRSPIQVRDKVYLLLIRHRFFTTDPAEKRKKWIAKHVALMIYAWAVFIFVTCPPLFIVNLVANELNIKELPQQETSKHVGAWGPWASTALVLIAALIARFHASGAENLKLIVSYQIKHVPHAMQRRRAARLRPDSEKGTYPRTGAGLIRPNETDRKKSTAPYTKVKKDVERSTWELSKEAMIRLWERYRVVRRIVWKNWEETLVFLNNPDNQARDTDRHGEEISSLGDCKGISIDKDLQIATNRNGTHDYTQNPSGPQNQLHALPAVYHSQRRQPSGPIGSRNSRDLPGVNRDHHTKSSDESPAKPTSVHTSVGQSPIPDEPLSEATPLFSDGLLPLIAPGESDCFLEMLEQEQGRPSTEPRQPQPPIPDGGRNRRSLTGLSQSLAWSMRSRQRRSMAYTPEISPHATCPISSTAVSPPDLPSAADTLVVTPQWQFSEPDLLQITHPPSPAPTQTPIASSQSPALISFSNQTSAQSSPNPLDTVSSPGHRSTVSYLQVERPRTMLFGDTITLRKGENGVYQIVEH